MSVHLHGSDRGGVAVGSGHKKKYRKKDHENGHAQLDNGTSGYVQTGSDTHAHGTGAVLPCMIRPQKRRLSHVTTYIHDRLSHSYVYPAKDLFP